VDLQVATDMSEEHTASGLGPKDDREVPDLNLAPETGYRGLSWLYSVPPDKFRDTT
jgi:hypothetical protein